MKNKYWQYIVDGNFSKSQSVDVNFLFNEGNIYISDNHLCALWGWLHECNPDEEYTFIHIDHHNDLKIPNIVDRLKSIENKKNGKEKIKNQINDTKLKIDLKKEYSNVKLYWRKYVKDHNGLDLKEPQNSYEEKIHDIS